TSSCRPIAPYLAIAQATHLCRWQNGQHRSERKNNASRVPPWFWHECLTPFRFLLFLPPPNKNALVRQQQTGQLRNVRISFCFCVLSMSKLYSPLTAQLLALPDD